MMATNMLFILDSTSKCKGLLRRACAVFAIPANRTVLKNLEMFVATYRTIKQDSRLSLTLELLTNPVLVRPSEVEFKDDGTAVVIVTLKDKDVVVVDVEDHIAIGLRSPEATTIKSTNSHAVFKLPMSSANSPPESVPVRTRSELAPFVWFEIGEGQLQYSVHSLNTCSTVRVPIAVGAVVEYIAHRQPQSLSTRSTKCSQTPVCV